MTKNVPLEQTPLEQASLDGFSSVSREANSSTQAGRGLIPVNSNTGSHFHDHQDHEGMEEPRLRDLSRRVDYLPRFLLLALIRLYQGTISRALPPDTCRFYPTCSHYGYQAIYKYGALKGSLMAAWRVLRCNPFNPGGFDPVP